LNETIYQLIKESAQRENLSIQEYIDLFSTAFRKVYCQGENEQAKLNFSLLPEKNEFLIKRIYEITDYVENPVTEISREDKMIKENKGEIKDNTFFLSLDLKSFSYSFNHQLQIKLLDEKAKKKEVPPYLKTKRFSSVNNSLSLEELQKIIFQEVPEIKEKKVKIEGILRLPGIISKVIVSSNIEEIHPLGACLGKEGMRAKTIQGRIGSEKIAFIMYEKDQKKIIQNIFKPFKIISWIEKEEGITIVFPTEQVYSIDKRLLQQIKDFMKKELIIVSLKELQRTTKFIVWNGNLSLEEYQQNYR